MVKNLAYTSLKREVSRYFFLISVQNIYYGFAPRRGSTNEQPQNMFYMKKKKNEKKNKTKKNNRKQVLFLVKNCLS